MCEGASKQSPDLKYYSTPGPLNCIQYIYACYAVKLFKNDSLKISNEGGGGCAGV